jgi:hypothetical protein
MSERFMGRKAEKSNEVTENQDSNEYVGVAFEHN